MRYILTLSTGGAVLGAVAADELPILGDHDE